MGFEIITGDILNLDKKVDAIVIPANKEPTHGKALDEKIYMAAGEDELLAIRKTIGVIEFGQAKVTGAYGLEEKGIKCLIHTVTPGYDEEKQGEIQEILKSCYKESIKKAYIMGCKSLAFPILSSGMLSWPIEEAKKIAKEVCEKYIQENNLEIDIFLVEYPDTESWKNEKKAELEAVPKEALGRGTYSKTLDEIQKIEAQKLMQNDLNGIIGLYFRNGIFKSEREIYKRARITGSTFGNIKNRKTNNRDQVWCLVAAFEFNEYEAELFFEKFNAGNYGYDNAETSDKQRDNIIKEFMIERRTILREQENISKEEKKKWREGWKEILDERLESKGFEIIIPNKKQKTIQKQK